MIEEPIGAPVVVAPGADLDPALLAFVKCHVTSPLKWDVLRHLTEQEGRWVGAPGVASALHRGVAEIAVALAELGAEGVLQQQGDQYRLPALEPTTVLLQRLLRACMRSQELRGIIAAHLLRLQRPLASAA